MSLGNAWKLRNAREKALILLAASVVVVGGGYEWGVAPVIKGRAELAGRLPTLRAESADAASRLEAQRQAAKTLAERKQPLSETSLRESLAQAQLQAGSIKLSGGAAEISINAGELAAILRWAAEAPAVFNVSIKNLSVSWKDGQKADVLMMLAP